MKNHSLLLFFLFISSFVVGQNHYLITVDQLHNRIKNGKDTTYIINFWATWCGPCIKEISHFEKLNKEYKSEKIKIILVSVDFKSQLETSVLPFIKKREIRSEVKLLNEVNQQDYINRIDPNWSGSIPATLFIKKDKNQKIENLYCGLMDKQI